MKESDFLKNWSLFLCAFHNAWDLTPFNGYRVGQGSFIGIYLNNYY